MKNIQKNIKIQKEFLKNKKLKSIYDEHVSGYTDEMNYKQINRYMYGKFVEFDTEDYIIPGIDGMFKIFNKIPKLETNTTVFRVSKYGLEDLKEIFISAFTSTTFDKSTFEEEIEDGQSLYEMIIPKDSKGIIAMYSKYYEDEKEIILPPGYYDLVSKKPKKMKNGATVTWYRLKLKKQVITLKDWYKHLELNNIKLEEEDYFKDSIKELIHEFDKHNLANKPYN